MEKERPSPTKSATLYNVGTIKTGNDGNKYIIVENKNGVKKWQKHKNVSNKKVTDKKVTDKKVTDKKVSDKKVSDKKVSDKKITALQLYNLKIVEEKDFKKIASKNETYKILITKVIPEINNLKIKTFIVPLPLSDNDVFWVDYPPHYIKEKYNQDLIDINYLYFVFYMNKKGDEIIYDKPININYSELTKENKINIINIFEKHLFGQYKWTGSSTDFMSISFYKNKDIKHIDTKIIKDNDYYPMLYINIDTNINLFDNQIIADKMYDYFEKLVSQYNIASDTYSYDMYFTIYLLDNKKIIEKLKKYIMKQKYIIKAKFSLIKSEHCKGKNIWSYTK